jgi:hypothetical protein
MTASDEEIGREKLQLSLEPQCKSLNANANLPQSLQAMG